jgi:predicted acetyltransferase
MQAEGSSARDAVSLQRATPDMAPLLANLLELYSHDLSGIFAVELGPDGRFGYAKLPLYWQHRDERFAFLVKHGERIAGFALATRGSPATGDDQDLDVAEFFVLRAFRRTGVGRRAAALLWDTVPGRWVVRVSAGNEPGLEFWRAAVGEYTNGAFDTGARAGHPHDWCIFTFTSRAAPPRQP